MVRDQADVEPVVRYFREQEIDALFIPGLTPEHFGTDLNQGIHDD